MNRDLEGRQGRGRLLGRCRLKRQGPFRSTQASTFTRRRLATEQVTDNRPGPGRAAIGETFLSCKFFWRTAWCRRTLRCALPIPADRRQNARGVAPDTWMPSAIRQICLKKGDRRQRCRSPLPCPPPVIGVRFPLSTTRTPSPQRDGSTSRPVSNAGAPGRAAVISQARRGDGLFRRLELS
jgi:hypothetical protein